MRSHYKGTFVLTWSQTAIDGLSMAPVSALSVGASWRWSGAPTRVDGPDGRLVLDGNRDHAVLRARAAKTIDRMLRGMVSPGNRLSMDTAEEPLFERSFSLTDGRNVYAATLVDVSASARPLVMFAEGLPPINTDLWITRCPQGLDALRLGDPVDNVMCFTEGTWLDTPGARRQVETLSPGDLVSTMDDGPQEIRWIGTRAISGARLQTFSALRPINIKTDAFGARQPQPDLLLSPQHRVLVRGAAARELFRTPEVLVSATDLLNDHSIRRTCPAAGVRYIHLLFDRHQVVWANGILAETFDPRSADLAGLEADEMRTLISACPDLAAGGAAFQTPARRALSAAEAAIMMGGNRPR